MTDAITPAHCRAARALLDWTLKRLSVRSGIANGALRDFERDRPALSAAALGTLRTTFETAGVQFQNANADGGIGVRLRAQPIEPPDLASSPRNGRR